MMPSNVGCFATSGEPDTPLICVDRRHSHSKDELTFCTFGVPNGECHMSRRSVPVEDIQCPPFLTGRFVRVENTASDGPIVLCEVEIWGQSLSPTQPVSQSCRSDIDRDHSVGVADLLLVLAAFGGRDACGQAEDIAGEDCVINVSDVLVVLSDFGQLGC